MARASKPEVAADEPAGTRRAVRRATRAPETASEALAPTAPGSPSIEAQPPGAPATEPAATEMPAEAASPEIPPTEAEIPAAPPAVEPPASAETVSTAEPPPPMVQAIEPASPVAPSAPAAPALHEIERLQGITLSFWQGQLERAMSTGQAIMVCRSPQAAIGLQVAYLQATLVASVEHASQIARLSRDMLSTPPR